MRTMLSVHLTLIVCFDHLWWAEFDSDFLWLATWWRLISLCWTSFQNWKWPIQGVYLTEKVYNQQRTLQISKVRPGWLFLISILTRISPQKCAFLWLWAGSQTFSVNVKLLDAVRIPCPNLRHFNPDTKYLKSKRIINLCGFFLKAKSHFFVGF